MKPRQISFVSAVSLRVSNRMRSLKPDAFWMFMLVAVLSISPLNPAEGKTDTPPCGRIQQVLASGSRFERRLLAEELTAPTAELVAACQANFERGFASSIRDNLAPPDPATWRQEQRWLHGLLLKRGPEDAERWLRRVDFKMLDSDESASLALAWAAAGTSATPAVLSIVEQLSEWHLRNRLLHDLSERLLDAEAGDVTAATNAAKRLAQLGYGELLAAAELATLWQFSSPDDHPSVAIAEENLVNGKLVEAFNAYAAAAVHAPNYLIHAGVLADRLFAEKRLDPTRLIPLGIEFTSCRDYAQVMWNLGSIAKATAALHGHPLADEAHFRSRTGCKPSPPEVDKLWREARRLSNQTSPAALRRRLEIFGQLAAAADDHRRQGRIFASTSLRREILAELGPPESYRFFTGAAKARLLRDELRVDIPEWMQ
jgi:hypothetical protein